jgi:hypothetical protein
MGRKPVKHLETLIAGGSPIPELLRFVIAHGKGISS